MLRISVRWEASWGEMRWGREREPRQAVEWVSDVPATSEVGTVAVVPWTCSHLQLSVMVNRLMGNVNTVGCCCFINQWDYKWFVRLLTSKWKDLIDWSENYQQDWEKREVEMFILIYPLWQCRALPSGLRWSIMKMSFDKQQTYMNITFLP